MMNEEDGVSKQKTVKVGKCAGEANRMHLPTYPISGGKKEHGTALKEVPSICSRSPTALYLS